MGAGGGKPCRKITLKACSFFLNGANKSILETIATKIPAAHCPPLLLVSRDASCVASTNAHSVVAMVIDMSSVQPLQCPDTGYAWVISMSARQLVSMQQHAVEVVDFLAMQFNWYIASLAIYCTGS